VRIHGSPDAAGSVYLLSHNTFASNTTCYIYMKSSLIRIRGLQISYSRKIDFRFQSSPARHVFPSPHIPFSIHFSHSSSSLSDTRRGFQRAARIRADVLRRVACNWRIISDNRVRRKTSLSIIREKRRQRRRKLEGSPCCRSREGTRDNKWERPVLDDLT